MSTVVTEHKNEEPVPVFANELKAEGNTLFAQRNYTKSSNAYSKIINEVSEDDCPNFTTTVRANRAACFIGLENYNEAIKDLECVLKTKGTGPQSESVVQKSHFRLAKSLYETGRYGDAIKELDVYRDLLKDDSNKAENEQRNKILHAIVERDKKCNQEVANKQFTTPVPVQPLRYEIRVIRMGTIVFSDDVPFTFCFIPPPKQHSIKYLDGLVRKYHGALMRRRQWHCWNCPSKAVSFLHTPAAFFIPADPRVVDFAQPICVNGGKCEQVARQMMMKDMAEVASGKRPMFY